MIDESPNAVLDAWDIPIDEKAQAQEGVVALMHRSDVGLWKFVMLRRCYCFIRASSSRNQLSERTSAGWAAAALFCRGEVKRNWRPSGLSSKEV